MRFSVNGRFLTQQTTGVQRYATELLYALDRMLDGQSDIKITVWSPRLRGPKPAWRNLLHREAGRLSGNLWEQLELPFLSRGDLLFCPGNTAPIISLAGFQPVVVTVHDLSYAYFPDAYSRTFRLWYHIVIPLAMRKAEIVLTVSETERESITSHFPCVIGRIHTVPNGGWPRDHMPSPVAPPPRDDGSVLYVGSLSKRKNFPAMLDVAISLARKRGLRFRFVGGTATSLAPAERIVPSDVKELIRFEGQTNDLETLARYYLEAGCFLFASLFESSGLPPVEAMACGCPVVASDTPALRERCGEAAVYCDPHSKGSISSAIEELVDSSERRSKMTELGYARARQLSWENCAAMTLELLAGHTKSRRKPAA